MRVCFLLLPYLFVIVGDCLSGFPMWETWETFGKCLVLQLNVSKIIYIMTIFCL